MPKQSDQYYIKLVQEAQLGSRQTNQRQKWATRLAFEQANLQAVFRTLLEKGQFEQAFDFTVRQVWYLYEQGDFDGLQQRYEALANALAKSDKPNPSLLGKILRNAATFAQLANQPAVATQHYKSALDLATDPAEIAALQNNLAILTVQQGKLEQALQYLHLADAWFYRESQWNDWAGSRQNLALIGYLQGRYTEAAQLFAESRQQFAALGNSQGLGQVLEGQAALALLQAKFAEATELAQQALALWQEQANWREAAGSYIILAEIKFYQNELTEAASLAAEAHRLYQEFDDKQGLIGTLIVLARIYTNQNSSISRSAALPRFRQVFQLCNELDEQLNLATSLESLAYFSLTCAKFEAAARLLGLAAAQRERLGTPLPPVDQARYTACQQALIAELGESSYYSEFKAGQSAIWPGAIENILNLLTEL